MGDRTKSFGETAKSLARNPLGIIALFIVLVYGLASLVTAFAGSFTPAERIPLIYFLITFPIMVLAVFAWLVSKHGGKLFAPSDFKDEENYVKMQMNVVASLTAATAKRDTPTSEAQLHKIVDVVRAAGPVVASTVDRWRNDILWVDDRPENNVYERQAFEAMGLRFTLALSTDEAFERLSQSKYAAIISDMGRREGPQEGYALLDRIRKEGDRTPLFFYAASNSPEHRRMTREHGGQGCTNNAQELFEMVTSAVVTMLDRNR
jgi:CheY-like chemotaxis protein